MWHQIECLQVTPELDFVKRKLQREQWRFGPLNSLYQQTAVSHLINNVSAQRSSEQYLVVWVLVKFPLNTDSLPTKIFENKKKWLISDVSSHLLSHSFRYGPVGLIHSPGHCPTRPSTVNSAVMCGGGNPNSIWVQQPNKYWCLLSCDVTECSPSFYPTNLHAHTLSSIPCTMPVAASGLRLDHWCSNICWLKTRARLQQRYLQTQTGDLSDPALALGLLLSQTTRYFRFCTVFNIVASQHGDALLLRDHLCISDV